MKRNRMRLHENWKFYKGDCPEAYYRGYDDSNWENVTVPHDFSVMEPFSKENSSGTGYLPGGIGWYRIHFILPENLLRKKVTVTFDGVYNNSQVWCNSNNLGKRPYGYTTFHYDITEFVNSGENVLSVRVNHEHTADSRWYTGSGIYRDVTVEISDEICFSRYGVFAATKEVTEEKATIEIKWKSETAGTSALFQLADVSGNIVSECKGNESSLICYVNHPKLWSVEQPYLYTLQCSLFYDGRQCDYIEIPFGIRTFRFDANRGLIFNGKSMLMKGVCLHHDAGVLGAAVPYNVWKRRLLKLKEAGCNAIRTSHNPPDPKLLSLCDKLGFVVMDEAFDEWEGCKNKWWQGHNVYPPKHYGYSEDFPVWHEADLTEMVCRDRNHVSVILWSIGNEIDYPNDPYCSPLFETMTGNNDANKPAQERKYDKYKPDAKRLSSIAKELVAIVKKYDRTRPVTAAIAFPELSNKIGYTDALDIVGYNYKEHLYEEDHMKYSERVLYGSENGHTEKAWAAVTENEYISGQFLWTGVDYMGEAKGWPVRVATPGLLTMAGFEKPEYYHRKALWTNELFAKLETAIQNPSATEREKRFQLVSGYNYKTGDLIRVVCYSNAKEAELFVNNQLIERITPKEQCCFEWILPFEPGCLKVIAYNGIKKTTDCLYTAKEAEELRVNLLDEDQEVIQAEVFLEDKDHNPVTQNDVTVEWSVTGAKFLGAESGAPDDLIPYTSNIRKTYQGRMIGYIKKNKDEECKIEVKMIKDK